MSAMDSNGQPNLWFITGIFRGFGRERASAVLQLGNLVIGTTRNGPPDLEAPSDCVPVLPLDVTHRSEVNSVVRKAWELQGRIGVVVNNAGFGLVRSQ
jgi:NAD(P)-dependent dehydrogenase (short-subunit alcohol dehydrogenase family)